MRRAPLLLSVLLALVGGLATGWILRGRALPPPGPSEVVLAREEEGVPGEVRLTPGQIQEAGIRVAPAAVASLGVSVAATGTLAGAADAEVAVSPRVPGRVVRFYVQVGDRVQAGAPLVELDSTEVAQAQARLRQARVQLELASRSLEVRRRLARVGDEFQRPLEEARAELASAQAALEAARAEMEAARRQLDRVESLFQEGIASGQQAEQARAAWLAARAREREARSRLEIARLHLERERKIRGSGLRVAREVAEAEAEVARARAEVGASLESLELLGADPASGTSSLTLRAPISGLVVDRPAGLGQQVGPGEPLARLLDPSRLWLWLQLHEGDLARVRPGAPVEVRVSSRTFSGRISYISPQMDTHTRTVPARVEVANDGTLKPGMYASARIAAGGGRPAVVVPAAAVQSVEGQDVVYVEGEPGRFRRQPVVLGARQADLVEVVGGLQAGQRVAVAGTFFLKSEDQKEALEGGEEH